MDQTRRCRRWSRAAGLAWAAPLNNRASPAAVHGFALTLAAGLVTGCSLPMPVAGLDVDAGATGSIDRTAAFLSPALDREDVRRARAALAVTLDPQGNGARVNWQNPQTGARGFFVATAPPFAADDRVCRAFGGAIVPAAGAERRVTGSACREGDGTWRLRDGGDKA